MEAAAWDAQPAVTKQIYFSFQYPGKVLHHPMETALNTTVQHKLNFFNLFIWLWWVFSSCMWAFSSCQNELFCSHAQASRCGGLLAGEHRLQVYQHQRLQQLGSVVVAHGLGYSAVWGIFPDGIELVSFALQGWFLTTGPPGKPPTHKLLFLSISLLYYFFIH